MGISNQLADELEGIFNQWSKVAIQDKEVKRLVRLAMAPSKEVWQNVKAADDHNLSTTFKNTCEDVFAYGMWNETQQLPTTKGTLFGAFNSITGYFQNVRNYKNDEAKVKSLLLGGTGAIRTQRAFDLCLAFAKKGSSALN